MAPRPQIHFLNSGRIDIASNVGDEQSTGQARRSRRGTDCAVRGPDCVVVGPCAVVERIVGRHRAVRIEPQDFAARVGENLRVGGREVVPDGQIDLSIVAEIDFAAVMLVVGVLRVLIENGLATGIRYPSVTHLL